MRIPTVTGPRVAPTSVSGGYTRPADQAFGAVQQLAGVVGGIGDQLAQRALQMQDEDNKTAAQDAHIKLNEAFNRIKFGDGDQDTGYYGKSGKDAVDGFKPTLEAMKEARRKIISELPNDAAKRMFEPVADRVLLSDSEEISRHTASQRRAWTEATREATIVNARDSAVLAFQSKDIVGEDGKTIRPAQWRVEMQRGRNAIMEKPIPDEAKMAEIRDFDSAVYRDMTKRIAVDDPAKAQAFFDENIGKMTAQDVVQMEDWLDARVTQQQAFEIEQGAIPSGPDWAIENVLVDEGGFVENDNGAPANFGINQGANPDIDVRNLTKEGAKRLYRERYWKPMGLDKLPPDLAYVAMDAAVNHGVAKAKQLLAKSDGDPQKLIALRLAEYERLARQNPGKYGDDLKGWKARLAKVSKRIEALPADADLDTMTAKAREMAGGNAERQRAFVNAAEARYASRKRSENERETALYDQAWQYAETATSEAQIPPNVWSNLKPQQRDSLRQQMAHNAKGEDPADNPNLYAYLSTMAGEAPQKFAKMDLRPYASRLPKGDWEQFMTLQRTAMKEAMGKPEAAAKAPKMIAWSNINRTAKSAFTDAGIEVGPKAGEDDKAAFSVFTRQLNRAAETFTTNNKRAPTSEELLKMSDYLMTEIAVSKPAGMSVFDYIRLGMGQASEAAATGRKTSKARAYELGKGMQVVVPQADYDRIRQGFIAAGEGIPSRAMIEQAYIMEQNDD